MDEAGGKASAHNATAVAGVSSEELQAELTRRAEQYEADSSNRLVTGLEASLAKHEAAVAHLKEQLKAAKAAAKEGTN